MTQLGLGLEFKESTPVIYRQGDLEQYRDDLNTVVSEYVYVANNGRGHPQSLSGVTSMDIETYPHELADRATTATGKATVRDPRALCYWSNRIALVGIRTAYFYYFILHPTKEDYDILRKLVTEGDIHTVGANLKFDITNLDAHAGIDPYEWNTHWDVIEASRLINAGLGHKVANSLNALSKELLGEELDKHIATTFSHKPVTIEQLRYNLSDLDVPLRIRYEQMANPLIDVDTIIEACSFVGFFADMTTQGLPLDLEAAEATQAAWVAKYEQLEGDFKKQYGISSNPSPNLGKALTPHGYEFESTSVEFLEQSKIPAAKQIKVARNCKKFVDAYRGALSSEVDGFVFCNYNLAATQGVGRSSSSSRSDRTGTNLQNLPNHKDGDTFKELWHLKTLKELVKPKKGYKFATFDLAGAHQAFSLSLSGGEKEIDLLYGDTSRDSHSIVASFALDLLFGLKHTPEEIKKGAKSKPGTDDYVQFFSVARDFSKELFYSILNGGTEYTCGRSVVKFFLDFIPNLKVDSDSQKVYGIKALEALKSVYPVWYSYIDTRRFEVKRKHTKMFNNERWAPLVVDGYPYWVNLEKLKTSKVTAVNWQRPEGKCMRRIAMRIREHYSRDLVKFCLFLHDELLLMIPEDREDIAKHCDRIFVDTFHELLHPKIQPMSYSSTDILKSYWAK